MPFKIYYLDDEPEILNLFAESFSAPGIEITTFLESKDFIEAVNSKAPDLLVIDYRLPGITGDQIALKIDPAIPKILVTGDIKVRTDYLFEAIVYKPYRLAAMQELILKYFPRKNIA